MNSILFDVGSLIPDRVSCPRQEKWKVDTRLVRRYPFRTDSRPMSTRSERCSPRSSQPSAGIRRFCGDDRQRRSGLWSAGESRVLGSLLQGRSHGDARLPLRFERAMVRWSVLDSPHPAYRMSFIAAQSRESPTSDWEVRSCNDKRDLHGLFVAKGSWHAQNDDLDLLYQCGISDVFTYAGTTYGVRIEGSQPRRRSPA